MKVFHNYSLQKLNTLRVKSIAENFIELESLDDLKAYLASRDKSHPLLMLGCGSNVVPLDHVPGDVIHFNYGSIEALPNDSAASDSSQVTVRVDAGVNWDHFVAHCLENNWYGLENLSLIPGTVGAAPIQNIGAYGVELEQLCRSVTVIDVEDGRTREIPADECGFSYRDSFFKQQWKQKYIVTAVTFDLSSVFNPCVTHQDLGSLPQAERDTALSLREAVISIRNRKLPDPNVLGNAGSFFKNCIVDESTFEGIQRVAPDVPSYALPDQRVKIPSAWLIDSLGWKGKQFGMVGVHAKQALVLVNLGQASGSDIIELAHKIQQNIKSHYGLKLEIEPSIIGFT